MKLNLSILNSSLFYVRNYYTPHNPNEDNNLVASLIINLCDGSPTPADSDNRDDVSENIRDVAASIDENVIDNRIRIYESNPNNQTGN